jgi:hypothetical protein
MSRVRILVALLVVVIAGASAVLLISPHQGGQAENIARQAESVARQAESPARPAQSPTLNASSFTAGYQRGWSVTTKTGPHGEHRYQLSSTGRPISPLGIPARATVGITIDESSTSIFANRRFASSSARALLPHIVGIPRGATAITRSTLPQRTLLGGTEAGEESYTYTYKGRQNVQVDVLAKLHARLVLVELDAEPTLARQSQTGLEALTQHWTWR